MLFGMHLIVIPKGKVRGRRRMTRKEKERERRRDKHLPTA